MERELRKAFEDTTTNNVKAILEYSTTTRSIVREYEKRIIACEFMIKSQREVVELLRTQLAAVQAKVYQNGTV